MSWQVVPRVLVEHAHDPDAAKSERAMAAMMQMKKLDIAALKRAYEPNKEHTMNPVVHFEIPYDNRDRIARFYQTAFGWQLQMLGEDMGNYVLATTAQADAKPGAPAGAINGGFYPAQCRLARAIPIGRDRGAGYRCRHEDRGLGGGKVLGEPMEIPGVGSYVSFFDTEGNRLSMLQPLPMADGK